jgi:tRNA 2-thiouridine synthesizing protein A
LFFKNLGVLWSTGALSCSVADAGASGYLKAMASLDEEAVQSWFFSKLETIQEHLMTKIIDLSGLACPLPVIRTKEALEAGESQEFIVVVDHDAARDNVSRFAQSRGCTVSVAAAGNCYHLTIRPPAGQPGETCGFPAAAPAPRTTVVVFASDCMGEGDPELGVILMRAFCQTVVQLPAPQKLLFYNRGIFLTLDDSAVLTELKGLEETGVELLVCGTCLDFYKVRDRLGAGKVSNMFSILESQMQAGRIIQP